MFGDITIPTTTKPESIPFRIFVLDVDGVLTDGKFYYSASGKTFKAFGADDNDALGILSSYVDIRFVTGDRKGFEISRRRIVDDMGYPLDLVSTFHRLEWIAAHYEPQTVAYMGDGIFDHLVMNGVGYSIAPSDAHPNARAAARFVTSRAGGDRAVAEASVHLIERFTGTSYGFTNEQVTDHARGEWAT